MSLVSILIAVAALLLVGIVSYKMLRRQKAETDILNALAAATDGNPDTKVGRETILRKIANRRSREEWKLGVKDLSRYDPGKKLDDYDLLVAALNRLIKKGRVQSDVTNGGIGRRTLYSLHPSSGRVKDLLVRAA